MPVSNRPSDHQSGGQQFGITAGKVEVVDATFIVDQYANDKTSGAPGALMTVAQLSLQMLTDNWEPDQSIDAVDNKYTCGGKFNQLSNGDYHLTFYPTNDPDSAYDKDLQAPDVGSAGDYLEGPRQPDKLSRWSQFMAACVKNGLKEDKIDNNIRCLIGSKFEIGLVKFAGVAGKEEQIAAPVQRFHTYPYETKPAASAKGKAAAAPAVPSTAKKAAAPKAPAPAAAATAVTETVVKPVVETAAGTVSVNTNGHDINSLSMEMIENVINAQRTRGKESVSLAVLARDVLAQTMQPAQKLTREEQKEIGANAKNPEFLAILADSFNFSVEGDVVKILPQ